MVLHRERDELDSIPEYAVPKNLVETVKKLLKGNNMADSPNTWSKFLERIKNLTDFDDDIYYPTLRNLLYLEECFYNNSIDDIKKSVKVKLYHFTNIKYKSNSFFKIHLKNIERDLCFLKKGSLLEVQNVKMFSKQKTKNDGVNVKKYSFTVTEVSTKPEYIIVEAKNYEKFRRQHEKDDMYYIEFEYSNWPIRVCQYAIELIAEDLESLQLYTSRKSKAPKTLITSFVNKNVARNPEQVQAVQHIVGGTSYPSPYLVFGPPGTGKTTTIVEAVCQLIERGKNILICTPSNAAADEITRRLLNCHISPKLIYRMTSKTIAKEDIPGDIKNCINFEEGEIENLHSYDMQDKKVIISTLVSAARFLRLTDFDHVFNYIFIDEAGQATQPETFIPFAISMRHKRCKIVMSGDPKQLGPVVRTKYGSNLLGISMLERLMQKSDLYKKDYVNKYDAKFLTKLVRNYRNHEAILRLPNQMFYDNELVACAGNKVRIAENWNHLPRKGFPIMFHAAFGHEEYNYTHSIANQVEAEIVMNYVEKLLYEGLNGMQISKENIGIVTPFRYQKSIILENLKNRNFPKISVGTVESFQGQERDIIIVSLVRSSIFKNGKKPPHIGFLNDDKRFNVTITRAKCLLIVIGHPTALQVADCWRNFINYCNYNRAYCADEFVPRNAFQSNNNNTNPQLSAMNIVGTMWEQYKHENNQKVENTVARTRDYQNQATSVNNQSIVNGSMWSSNYQIGDLEKIENHQNMGIMSTRNDQNQVKNVNNQNIGKKQLTRTRIDQIRDKSDNNKKIEDRNSRRGGTVEKKKKIDNYKNTEIISKEVNYQTNPPRNECTDFIMCTLNFAKFLNLY